MKKPLPHLLLALSLCVLQAPGAGALTLFRLGGEGLPEPEAADFGVPEGEFRFEQLPWSSIAEDDFGSATLIELQPGYIEPQSLDPSVNLTPLIRERGGTIKFNDGYDWKDEKQLDLLFDGDETTAYLGESRGNLAICARGSDGGPGIKEDLNDPEILCRYVKFDFGGPFFIDRVQFFPRERNRDTLFPKAFRIGTNDGDPLKYGTRQMRLTYRSKVFTDWNVVVDRLQNTDPVVDAALPPEPVQALIFEAPAGQWEIAEFRIFGSGFTPFARYVSRVIDLGGPAVLGELTWAGELNGGQVDVSARSGDTADPNTYWRFTFRGDERSRFDPAGAPLDRTAYGRLEGGEKAGISPDRQNWEAWPPFFDFAAGAAGIESGKPRRFVQLRAEFNSGQGLAGGRLEYLQFAATQPPMADEIRAEIHPAAARAGEPTAFTLSMRPRILGGDSGFDTIQIGTPAEPRVEAVLVSGVEVGWEPVRVDSSGLRVRLASALDASRSGELVEIRFEAEVFRFGTVFSGAVSSSERPFEQEQAVAPGNADDLVDSNGLTVALREHARGAIGAFELSSAVVTPNGDGANDELAITWDLVNLEPGSAPGSAIVALELYSLSGRRLAVLGENAAASGRGRLRWNGSAGGGKVPPGTYVLRLAVDADAEGEAALRLVSVAY